MSDNAVGAHHAVAHLIELGHTRIGFLGDLRQIASAVDRFSGYSGALAAAGIEVDEALVRFDLPNADAAEEAARVLLDGPQPTALFAAQNLVTIGALRALRAQGLSRRVALVGFDDFPLADMLEPAVTVVAQDPAAIGAKACEVLFQQMDGVDSPPRLHTIPTRLIVRGSGEIPPS
jgi:LacI family transcriptional regulator